MKLIGAEKQRQKHRRKERGRKKGRTIKKPNKKEGKTKSMRFKVETRQIPHNQSKQSILVLRQPENL
jgi:hypothetical protein